MYGIKLCEHSTFVSEVKKKQTWGLVSDDRIGWTNPLRYMSLVLLYYSIEALKCGIYEIVLNVTAVCNLSLASSYWNTTNVMDYLDLSDNLTS